MTAVTGPQIAPPNMPATSARTTTLFHIPLAMLLLVSGWRFPFHRHQLSCLWRRSSVNHDIDAPKLPE